MTGAVRISARAGRGHTVGGEMNALSSSHAVPTTNATSATADTIARHRWGEYATAPARPRVPRATIPRRPRLRMRTTLPVATRTIAVAIVVPIARAGNATRAGSGS